MADLTQHEVDTRLACAFARIEARLAETDLKATSNRAVMREQFSEVKAEMRAELRSQLAEIRIEIYKSTVELIAWGCFLAIAVLFLIAIFIAHANA
ncbi:hypothetical protein GCM10027321_15130 [Massilia terrae]|uniref:DUF1640 domain-containing protein n=1 Tax=Massilia terrae TaxID=1811224 RepID=A0ABT2D0W7_9BURK|nr:hypothetical protein [Massilia terrae]MCS0659894.1 hypothetical protein [Massilia terrae]